jgi:hypothetical protein
MGRNQNGDFAGKEADEDDWRPLLYGAQNADKAIPVILKAANAMLVAGNALNDIAKGLKKIGDDTARAISDTVDLKRHLETITAREQTSRDNERAMAGRLRAIEKQLARPPKKTRRKQLAKPSKKKRRKR